MPPLNPRRDFRDDGGTPSWRYRHTIDARRPGLRGWFRRQPFAKLALLALWLGFGVPMAVLVGGVVFAYLFSKATGL